VSRSLTAQEHPLLDARAFVTLFPEGLGAVASSEALVSGLRLGGDAPMESNDVVRLEIRNLLRHGGFKPAGRSKPASEYLLRAESDGFLGQINPAVDACNVASLHSGIPVSVIDLELTEGALQLSIAPENTRYVFNAAGQEIDVSGLICLSDVAGPCANPVKDSQRTKTSDETRRTLSVIWGTSSLPGRSERLLKWYRDLVETTGCETSEVRVEPAR
jgi:DNA/RNA-binding domain of Phe-tRNA-synthetase-like protein